MAKCLVLSIIEYSIKVNYIVPNENYGYLTKDLNELMLNYFLVFTVSSNY